MESKHRTQSLRPHTGQQKTYIAIAVIALLLIVALVLLIIGHKRGYTPPEFDENAKVGVPSPDEGFLYDTVATDFGYQFRIAANLYQQEDATVKAFFTNPAENEVYLMCEITSEESGEVLYKSGALRPGEYVESISPCSKFANEAMNVVVKVYAFEPGTWYSAGTTSISAVLQAW